MNITLSVDQKTAGWAHKVAQAISRSLNHMVRDYMRDYVEQWGRQDEPSEACTELRRLSAESNGDSRG